MMQSERWPDHPLMLVTDRRRVNGDLVAAIEAAVEGGVNVVQLREKDLTAGELLELARRVRGVTAGRALLLVNDRVDVALLAGADGAHLGEAGLPVAAVRAWLPAGMLVGRSVHGVAGARQAELDGADYLVAGTLFPSRSHPDAAPTGPGLLAEIVARVSLPVLGIGGIGLAEAVECRRRGAAGVAVVDAILAAPDPRAAAAALRAAIESG
jgi:thiamine-phosphate diphosphorylase